MKIDIFFKMKNKFIFSIFVKKLDFLNWHAHKLREVICYGPDKMLPPLYQIIIHC